MPNPHYVLTKGGKVADVIYEWYLKGMALVGIAFSIGFIVGPIIGAVFSIWGRERADNWFVFNVRL